jgi:hypothetical protein
MPREQLRFGKGFRVSLKNARAQSATMYVPPAYTTFGIRYPEDDPDLGPNR